MAKCTIAAHMQKISSVLVVGFETDTFAYAAAGSTASTPLRRGIEHETSMSPQSSPRQPLNKMPLSRPDSATLPAGVAKATAAQVNAPIARTLLAGYINCTLGTMPVDLALERQLQATQQILEPIAIKCL